MHTGYQSFLQLLQLCRDNVNRDGISYSRLIDDGAFGRRYQYGNCDHLEISKCAVAHFHRKRMRRHLLTRSSRANAQCILVRSRYLAQMLLKQARPTAFSAECYDIYFCGWQRFAVDGKLTISLQSNDDPRSGLFSESSYRRFGDPVLIYAAI